MLLLPLIPLEYPPPQLVRKRMKANAVALRPIEWLRHMVSTLLRDSPSKCRTAREAVQAARALWIAVLGLRQAEDAAGCLRKSHRWGGYAIIRACRIRSGKNRSSSRGFGAFVARSRPS